MTMATLKSLAAELNLSVGTVSLALRNSPRIHPDTAKRVLELAAKRDYAPNNFGRALQSGRSRLLGCVLGCSLLNSFFDELIEGMGRRAAASGYGMMINWRTGNQIGGIIDRMLEHRVEGVIFTGLTEGEQEARRLEKNGTRFIFCSTRRFLQYPTVVNDDFAGGVMAAECMLQHRHTNFLLEQTTSAERLRGAVKTLEGKASYQIFACPEELPEAVRRTGATAVICFSDLTAIDGLFLLRQQDIRVPAEVSLIGYDNLPIASRPEFELTTIGQQRIEMGELAADYIIRAGKGYEQPMPLLLQPQLFFRKTVTSR